VWKGQLWCGVTGVWKPHLLCVANGSMCDTSELCVGCRLLSLLLCLLSTFFFCGHLFIIQYH
jgi:hypothetical protein